MHAFRTYIFYQSLNRLQRGRSAIAELLVIPGIPYTNVYSFVIIN